MTTRSAKTRATPVGREEVAAAVLEAAATLFAQRGPASTSIRDVAAESKVNHGLVFRHFGTKDRLVGAVLDHLAARSNALIERGAPAAELEDALGRHSRVLARALLDGYPVGELQSSFPAVARLLEHVRPRFDDETSARLATANAAALQLGWQLFRPFLVNAAGLDGVSDHELARSISDAVGGIVDRAASPLD